MSAEILRSFFVVYKGLNTKQLTNQMLELTKVINELKDVLIQQVKPFCPLSFSPFCLMFLISTIPSLRPRFFLCVSAHMFTGEGNIFPQKHHL